MLTIRIVALLSAAVLAYSIPQTHEHLHQKYDYIVVGSGAGGGPLASRLAIAGHKVLIIEAGDDEGHAIDQQVPALHLQSTEYTPMKWDYFVHHYADQTRQKKDTKMSYNTTEGKLYTGLSPPNGAKPLGVLYPRAGTLGGCGAHNALISVLPFDKDWTYIQELTGDDSWSPANMRDYFKRLEKNEYLPKLSNNGHGYNGWFKTSLTSLTLVIKDLKLLSLIISAATAQGKGLLGGLITTVTGLLHVLTADLNSETPWRDTTQNVYQVPIAVDNDLLKRNGPREFILSVANAVNADGSRKYHLDIWVKTLATKVRFDTSGDTPKAVGVEYIQGQSLYAADPRYAAAKGTPGYVAAKKEVIISAGAFNTPQLLKLSGIGPKAELKKFGIKVIKDLPGVGTNLQDRYETGVIGRNPGEFVITKDCTFGYTLPDPCLDQWKSGTTKDGKGTYTTNGIAIAITKRSTAAADEDPDVLITGAPAAFKGYYPDYARIGLQDANHWTWIILKAHTRNTAGTVKLRSANPQDVPEITMHYFSEGSGAWQDDLQAVVEGMEWARTAYADLIPLEGRYTEVWPGENVTDDALKEFIQNEAWGHHASCTAAIGKDGDPMAVLDGKFRVRGVKRLRVVDAAAFPKIPGYYIALPTYMISEKAADVILGKAHHVSEEDGEDSDDGGSGIDISL